MYSIHQRLHFFFSVDSYYILRSFNFWMVKNSINLSSKLYLSEWHQLDFDENWNWDFGINLNQLEWDFDESLITVSFQKEVCITKLFCYLEILSFDEISIRLPNDGTHSCLRKWKYLFMKLHMLELRKVGLYILLQR